MASNPRLAISSRMRPNAAAVTREVLARFPEVTQIWTYGLGPDHDNCRCTDFMSYRDTALGQRIADYCERNADRLGVRYIIWNRRIWRRHATSKGPARTWTRYTGPNSHVDHVHLEVEDKRYEPPAAPAPREGEDMPDMPTARQVADEVWTVDRIPNVDSRGQAIFTGNAENKTVAPQTVLVDLARDLAALRREVAAVRTDLASIRDAMRTPPGTAAPRA